MLQNIKVSLGNVLLDLKVNKIIRRAASMIAVLAILFTINVLPVIAVHAETPADETITSSTAQQVQNRMYGNIKSIAKVVGIVCITGALVMVGVSMLINYNRPDARSQGMDALLTIIIAAVIIGSISIFIGFIWSNAGGMQ